MGYHLTLQVGDNEPIPCVFAKRDWLKREHPTKAATINGEATKVVVISAREFADNRVWIQLPNGDAGRFLVPKTVDLDAGPLAIMIADGSTEYKREELRVREKIARKKKEAIPRTV